ncbi:MAG: energy transducer TonB [Stenotrophomonas sp.]
MKSLSLLAVMACLPALVGCTPQLDRERTAKPVCRSKLTNRAEACANKAEEALKRIVAKRGKRFDARDACAAKSTRSAQPSISFFSVLLNPLDYPPGQRVGGTAVLQMQVDAAGKLQSVQVVQSSGDPAQDAAAAERVWDWCYVPAQREGKDVGGFVEHRFSFDIDAP